ncbi:hypothetical protein EJ357_45420 [Streptomyces cyaneochromogenes]|uniref:LysR substrate-binding domain-containing protein n=1 Tax=Streptomyces cyaneochromogenes TaxID=2496836 RepID=A0A3S9MP46_9ACTN|nr:hypothetical protein EJ357_45420 [Streptomyces cyaneochromogenes]
MSRRHPAPRRGGERRSWPPPLITYGPDSGLYPRLRRAFQEAEIPFRPACSTDHVALQLELVAAGAGIALAAGGPGGASPGIRRSPSCR